MSSPVDPIDDFGRHNTVLALLLGIDALAAHVESLADPAAGEPAGASQPTPLLPGDDFVLALTGLVALRASIRRFAASDEARR